MRQIRIQRKASSEVGWDRYVVLPLDARDPDVLRAKELLRRRSRPFTRRPNEGS